MVMTSGSHRVFIACSQMSNEGVGRSFETAAGAVETFHSFPSRTRETEHSMLIFMFLF